MPTIISFKKLQVTSKLAIYFQPRQLESKPREYELAGLGNSHLKPPV